jgi:hypothetical protein
MGWRRSGPKATRTIHPRERQVWQPAFSVTAANGPVIFLDVPAPDVSLARSAGDRVAQDCDVMADAAP